MEVKKTHIFLKKVPASKFTQSKEKVEAIKVVECRIDEVETMSSTPVYFKEVRSGYHQVLEMITREEFLDLDNETYALTKNL